MRTPTRFASALSVIAVATVLAGCATSQSGAGGAAVAGKSDVSKAGHGTRALLALNAGDYGNAIQFGEQAVEQTPTDATVRTILANAYFGAGRFASAEAAYRDSLTINSNQPQLVLRLALVQIAQGKNSDALSLLASAHQMLDRADLGLALALAGQPRDAITILEPAARAYGADSRVRQNLAFAQALAGDWTAARNIAAQDLAANLVDERIEQWMTLAKPARPSDQVAAFTGVRPAPVDPGQPVRLALRPVETRTAAVAPPPAPAAPTAAPAPAAVVAEAPALPALPELPALPPVAEIEPAAPVAEQPVMAALVEAAPEPVAPLPTRFEQPRSVASTLAVAKRPLRARGNSTAVVQLGAYGSPKRVAMAWDELSRRYPALNGYRPVSARFASPKGIVYRLSVKGFASNGEAQNMCQSLQAKGKNCFVRRVAGDAPVRFAAR